MLQVLAWLGLGILFLTAYAAWRGAPWLPTPHRAVEAALAAVGVRDGDLLVDLGAGDGRVLREAARRGARAVGYELSPLLWLVAWVRTRQFGLRLRGSGSRSGQARVLLRDGFRADLSSATVLFAFLRPATMPRLAHALNRRPLAGSVRILTYAFPLPDRAPSRVLALPHCAPLYVYTP